MLSIDEDFDNVFFTGSLVDVGFAEAQCSKDLSGVEAFAAECEVYDIMSALEQKSSLAVCTFANAESSAPKLRSVKRDVDYICFSNSIQRDFGGWSTVKCGLKEHQVVTWLPKILHKYDYALLVDNSVSIVDGDMHKLSSMMDGEYLLMFEDKRDRSVYCVAGNKYIKLQDFMAMNGLPSSQRASDASAVVLKPSDRRSAALMSKMQEAMDATRCFDYRMLLDYSVWASNGRRLVVPCCFASSFFIK